MHCHSTNHSGLYVDSSIYHVQRAIVHPFHSIWLHLYGPEECAFSVDFFGWTPYGIQGSWMEVPQYELCNALSVTTCAQICDHKMRTREVSRQNVFAHVPKKISCTVDPYWETWHANADSSNYSIPTFDSFFSCIKINKCDRAAIYAWSCQSDNGFQPKPVTGFYL